MTSSMYLSSFAPMGVESLRLSVGSVSSGVIIPWPI